MPAAALAPLLARYVSRLDPALGLRAEAESDYPFIVELFAEIRQDELAPVPWPEQAKREFLATQCRLQHDQYLRNYDGAELLLIEHAGSPVGRVYVHAAATEIRLMEIALQGAFRNRGIGAALVRSLQQEAGRRGIGVTLHVEPANPAQHLYRRLGFRLIENRGVYDFLGWTVPDAGSRPELS